MIKDTQTFVKSNVSQKNNKQYVEMLTSDYSKLVYEAEGAISTHGLNKGDKVQATFSLQGEAFKHRLVLTGLQKV